MDTQDIIIGVAVMAVLVVLGVIYSSVKEKFDLKKAESGEDMTRLKKAVAAVLPDLTGYELAYAHWEKKEYAGRATHTYYYSYGLAFGAENLYVVPLSFDADNDPEAGEPLRLTRDMLGIAKVKFHENPKTGETERVDATLFAKDGKELVSFFVDRANTREDRFHHFNIVQPEECRKFGYFMEEMAGRVQQENEGLEDRLSKERAEKDGRTALIFGILGAVFCLLPIVGLVLGALGAAKAPKPRQTGGRPGAPLLVSIGAILLNVVILVVVISFL